MLFITWPNNLVLKIKANASLLMLLMKTTVLPPLKVYPVFTSRRAPLCKINSTQCLLSWHSRFYSALGLEHPTLHTELDREETSVHQLSHCGTIRPRCCDALRVSFVEIGSSCLRCGTYFSGPWSIPVNTSFATKQQRPGHLTPTTYRGSNSAMQPKQSRKV